MSNEGELNIEREREIKNNRSLVSLIYSSNDEKEKKKEEYAKRIYPGLHSESSTRDSTSRISKAFSFQESQGFLFRRKREKSQRTSWKKVEGERKKKSVPGILIPRVSFEGWLPLPLPHPETQKDR